MRLVLLACLLVGAWGCSDDNEGAAAASGAGGSSSSNASGAGPSSSTTSAGGSSGDWETLLEGEWSLAGGSENYACVVATVPDDIYITRFRPIAPTGTHHTVLTRGASGPDGVSPCSAGTNGQNMIYGSGVGTGELALPAGVAVHLTAGEKLLLNLHLFNTSPSEITGVSGVEVIRMDPGAVVDEAESLLAGTINIALPAQAVSSVTGHCTMPSAKTIFAVGPHMHQLGIHMTVTALGTPETVLLDADYTFDQQTHYPLDPVAELTQGDQVRVECTYNNDTNQIVTFGDSSLAEMCFAGLFLYPASGRSVICMN